MKPISGLIELPDDLLTERNALIHREIKGLGPEDLVVLEKVKPKGRSIRYYHNVCGQKVSGPNSFIEYLQTLSKKKLGKGKYIVSAGEYCCWNSFRACDIRIQMEGMAVSGVRLVDFDGESTIQDESIWKELEICSVLRFFKIPSPVFRAVYNFEYYNCSALKLSKPGTLTDEQIQYIVDNHPKSEELYLALAGLLVSLGKWPRILNLLENVIIKKMPRVIVPLYQLLPKYMPFLDDLIKISKDAYLSYPDDTKLAFIFVSLCIDSGKTDELDIVLPVVRSTMWSSPYACCAMAKVMIHQAKTDEALFCVNAAFHSKMYKNPPKSILTGVVPNKESKSAPKVRPNIIDSELVSSQNSSLQHILYTAILDIYRIVSPCQIRDLLGQNFRVSLSKEIENGTDKIALEPSQPKPTCDELDGLYDPGIESSSDIPDVVRQLPLCSKLSSWVKEISEDWSIRTATLRGRKWDASADVRKALIIALKMRDFDMLQSMKAVMKSAKKLAVMNILVTFSLATGENWITVSKKFSKREINPKKVTINEYNALTVMYTLANGIDQMLAH